MRYNVKKIRPLDVMEYLLAMLLVLNCSSVYMQVVKGNNYINLCLMVVSMLMTAFSIKTINKKVFYVSIFQIIFSLVYIFATGETGEVRLFSYLFLFFLPCMLFYFGNQYNKKNGIQLFEKLANIIFILSCISTLVWFLTEIIPLLEPTMKITVFWGRVNTFDGVLGLYFKTQTDATFGIKMYRNSGIFCEAPMHALILELALLYELFMREKLRFARTAILSIVLLTTISSAGIIFLVLSLSLRYWNALLEKIKKHKYIAIGIFACLCIPVAFMFIREIMLVKSSTHSYTTRMIDYISGFSTWMESPIFGTGFNNLSEIYKFKLALMTTAGTVTARGFSNSIAAIPAQGGIWLSFMYLYPIMMMTLIAYKRKNRNIMSLGIILIYMLIVIIFHTTFIMVSFIAMAWIYIINEDRRRDTK